MEQRKVKNLKKGDKLTSGILIVSNPVAGLYTPKGKVEIGVEYPNGNTKVQIWNKETIVNIE